MILVVVSVFDKAAGAYGRPVFVPAVGQAIRSFQDEVNRAGDDNPVFKHPSDFDLFKLGVFDDSLGRFDNVLPAPELLASGASLRYVKGGSNGGA